jgi:hypothetical protein
MPGDAPRSMRMATSAATSDSSARIGVSRDLHLAGLAGRLPSMDHPRAGEHYPRSLGEFQAWIRTDADCLDYLEWLRWPTGFVCPACLGRDGWRLGDGRFKCTV